MRTFVTFTACALALIVVAGCKQTSVEGPGGKKLTLMKPADQTLTKGTPNQVMITINRDNFRDEVSVSFDNLPQGVTVQDKDKKIANGDSTASFTLLADANAALVQNHEVRVTVTGPDNMKATEVFRLSVK